MGCGLGGENAEGGAMARVEGGEGRGPEKGKGHLTSFKNNATINC